VASRQWNAGDFLRQPRRADVEDPWQADASCWGQQGLQPHQRAAIDAAAPLLEHLPQATPRRLAPPPAARHRCGSPAARTSAAGGAGRVSAPPRHRPAWPALPWAGAAGDPGLAPYLRACTAADNSASACSESSQPRQGSVMLLPYSSAPGWSLPGVNFWAPACRWLSIIRPKMLREPAASCAATSRATSSCFSCCLQLLAWLE